MVVISGRVSLSVIAVNGGVGSERVRSGEGGEEGGESENVPAESKA